MDEAVVGTIQAQQQDIRERWGNACQYLFPCPLSHLLPFKQETFSRMLNAWACEKQIRDQCGNLYHFQSHQFRHTVGMQLINEDVPLDVISRLFGHGSLSVDELLSQLRSDLTEAESGLEEACEAGLPLAAKHLERTIPDLKMRIAALEETV